MSKNLKVIGFSAVILIAGSVLYSTVLKSSLDNDEALQDEALQTEVSALEAQVASLQAQLAIGASNQDVASQVDADEGAGFSSMSGHHQSIDTQESELPSAEQLWLDSIRTLAADNPYEVAAELQSLLGQGASAAEIKIATRGIYELSSDINSVPDHLLTSIYDEQEDEGLRRLSAQILSMRGDNSLLEKYVDEKADQFVSEDPVDRSNALYEVSQTGHSAAVPAVMPLLNDIDSSVRMDALLALRRTGNKSHVEAARVLIDDPDPHVREMALDVLDNLGRVSETERSSMSEADIFEAHPSLHDPQ